MAFNTEGVARAIFASRVPVVSAVGHEIDFTIADFVADMRAPTPSAAAELVVPMRGDLTQQIRALIARLVNGGGRLLKLRKDRLDTLAERVRDPRRRLVDLRLDLDERFNSLSASLVRRVRTERDRLRHFETHLQYLSPGVKLANLTFVLDNMRKSMITGIFRQVDTLRVRLAGRAVLLDSLSPLSVLARGYAIARVLPEGKIIRDAGELTTGDPVGINVAKGRFDAVVTKIEKE
jgi:exodeoxyribonuclease VII large subunit